MAQILSTGKVKKNDGTVIQPEELGWYDGQQYSKGTLQAQRGVINSQSDQQGAGQAVSEEVNKASAVLQGKTYPELKTYLGQNSQLAANAVKNAATSGGGTSSGGSGSSVSGGAESNYNVTETYDKLYKELGVDEKKAVVTAKQDEITSRRKRLADAEATINENPLYAETTRTGKLRRLEEQANADITNLEREQALAQAQVDEANTQLGVKSNLGTQQYQMDRQAQQDAVAELNSLISAGANMNGINADDFAAKTGMSSATIQALMAASQANEIKPTVIQSTNDAGVVTVTIIDQNTGAIVGQQNLGAIGNAQTGGSGKASESEMKSYYIQQLRGAVTGGMGVRDIFSNFQGLIDPNQIIQIYNANSPNGVAKENSAELAALGVKPYLGVE